MTKFVLQIPNIVLSPPIEELQHYFGKLVLSVVENHKVITAWGQRYSNIVNNEPVVITQGLLLVSEKMLEKCVTCNIE